MCEWALSVIAIRFHRKQVSGSSRIHHSNILKMVSGYSRICHWISQNVSEWIFSHLPFVFSKFGELKSVVSIRKLPNLFSFAILSKSLFSLREGSYIQVWYSTFNFGDCDRTCPIIPPFHSLHHPDRTVRFLPSVEMTEILLLFNAVIAEMTSPHFRQ